MPVKFACPHCQKRLSVSSEKAGKRAKCPSCKQVLLIPAKDEANRAGQKEPADIPPEPPPPPVSGEPLREPSFAANDAYSEFVVYDDDPEWHFETDEPPSRSSFDGSVDWNKVAVPRGILYVQGVLLGVVGVASFVCGIFVGQGSSSKEELNPAPKPCVISGTIKLKMGREALPDEGCVVIVLPKEARPDQNEKVPLDNMRPNDTPPGPEHEGIRAIKQIGGDYTRANAKGDFRLKVPDVGQYYVLFLSHQGQRKGEPLDKVKLSQLGRYFLDAAELLGDNKYEWEEHMIRRDKQLNLVF